MKTLQQFAEEAAKQGYNTVREFNDILFFMDFCYRYELTPANSFSYTKEDGTGVYIAFDE